MHLEGIVSKRAELIFAGKAGTGFDLATGHELPARLRKIERNDPPFASAPRAYQRGARSIQSVASRRSRLQLD
jgi:hypothetical protein